MYTTCRGWTRVLNYYKILKGYSYSFFVCVCFVWFSKSPLWFAHSPKEFVFDDDDGDNDGDCVLDRLAGLYEKEIKKGKVERKKERDG